MLENALFVINTAAFCIWFVSMVMTSASSTALKSYIMLQKRALRNINRAKYRAHTEPFFKLSLILKLTDLYEYQVTLFVWFHIEQTRSKIHFLTFEMYWSENDFYCGQSYIARFDERIRFNG